MKKTKLCSGCGKRKPVSGFYKDKRIKSGLCGSCKTCMIAKSGAYYAANLEKAREQRRAYHAAHPEKARERVRAWRIANPEKVKEWLAANPEKVWKHRRTYYAANSKKVIADTNAYKAANPEKVKEWQRAWYAANRDKELDRRRAWRVANRDKVREGLIKYKYGLTPSDYNALCDSQESKCAICGGNNGGKKLHVDHDHATGGVRGLLCKNCNVGIGFLGDSAELTAKATKYLRKWARKEQD